MSTGETWTLGRRPALDGLRGVAVLLVILSHAGVPGMLTSGAVGVTVFFTLSGFLITSLLLEERARDGGFSLRRFYARRARRLFPALGAYVAVVASLTWLLRGYLDPLAVGTVAYVANWMMADGVWAKPTLFGHTWSLSIEEQFYLLWPLLLIVGAKMPRRWLLLLVGTGAFASLCLRVAYWDGGDGRWRTYFGLDVRADALLIGCVLAFVMHGARERRPSRLVAPLGLSVLVLTCAMREAATFVLMPTVVATATAAVIHGVTQMSPPRWLSWAPLRLVGQRSYGVYLWQAATFSVAASLFGESMLVGLLIAVPATWLAASLSWRFIEQPFLRQRQVSGRTTEPSNQPLTVPA